MHGQRKSKKPSTTQIVVVSLSSRKINCWLHISLIEIIKTGTNNIQKLLKRIGVDLTIASLTQKFWITYVKNKWNNPEKLESLKSRLISVVTLLIYFTAFALFKIFMFSVHAQIARLKSALAVKDSGSEQIMSRDSDAFNMKMPSPGFQIGDRVVVIYCLAKLTSDNQWRMSET
jgi:hypothetical protein